MKKVIGFSLIFSKLDLSVAYFISQTIYHDYLSWKNRIAVYCWTRKQKGPNRENSIFFFYNVYLVSAHEKVSLLNKSWVLIQLAKIYNI